MIDGSESSDLLYWTMAPLCWEFEGFNLVQRLNSSKVDSLGSLVRTSWVKGADSSSWKAHSESTQNLHVV